MRHMILLVALGSLAACGDNARPTAPRTSSDQPASLVRKGSGAIALGKPATPVGFTKITMASSLTTVIAADANGEATAVCPAGTTIISGGYHIVAFNPAVTPPWITWNDVQGENTWVIHVYNKMPGASSISLQAVAYCVS